MAFVTFENNKLHLEWKENEIVIPIDHAKRCVVVTKHLFYQEMKGPMILIGSDCEKRSYVLYVSNAAENPDEFAEFMTELYNMCAARGIIMNYKETETNDKDIMTVNEDCKE